MARAGRLVRLLVAAGTVFGVLAGAAVVGIAPAAATSTTLYVGPGGGTGNCNSPAYSTIQSAVIAASSGDTVQVCPGTYPEQVTIDKSLTLLGDPGSGAAGPGSNAPVLDGTTLSSGSACVAFDLTDGVTDVTISGFVIKSYRCGTTVTSNVGIRAWNETTGTSNVSVTHDSFSDILWAAVLVGSDYSSVQQTGWTVSNNVVAIGPWSSNDNVYGIELTNTMNSTVSNNTVSGGYQAILTQPRGTSDNITISGNTVTNNENAGIQIAPYSGATAQNIDVTGNSINTGSTGIHVGNLGTVSGIDINENAITAPTVVGIENDSSVSLDATDNWWGCAGGPNTAGCTTTSGAGAVTSNPWLATLGLSPSFQVAKVGSNATVSATLHDSNGAFVSAPLDVVFTTSPNVASASSSLSLGTASFTFTDTTPEVVTVDAAVAFGAGPTASSLTGSASVSFAAATTTSVVASPNPSPAGSSVTLTATVSPAKGTGTVEFLNGASPITGCTAVPLTSAGTATCGTSFASAGTYTVSATYSGNTYYSGSTGTTTVTVNPAASTTALSLSSGSIAYGHEQAETMSVTVSAQSSTLVPTGTVTISAGSATICAITLVDGKGSCTLSASQLQRGTYELVATFAGNADVNGSSSPASSLVVTVKSAIDYYVALLHGLWVANGEPRIGTAKYRAIAHEAWIEAGKPKLPPLLFKQAHAGA